MAVTYVFSLDNTVPTNDCWLVESHLSGCFCLFAPKFLEGGWDLRMILCQFVSAISTLKGGGRTLTVTAIIKFV